MNWWKNFREGHPATLWLAGEPVEVVGDAVLDPDKIADWLVYLGACSWLWRRVLDGFGVSIRSPRDELEATAEDLVVVRFERV